MRASSRQYENINKMVKVLITSSLIWEADDISWHPFLTSQYWSIRLESRVTAWLSLRRILPYGPATSVCIWEWKENKWRTKETTFWRPFYGEVHRKKVFERTSWLSSSEWVEFPAIIRLQNRPVITVSHREEGERGPSNILSWRRAYSMAKVQDRDCMGFELKNRRPWSIAALNVPGVSMLKIEVASRFEKSNRLYQKEAFTPHLQKGSGGVLPLKISKFKCPKMRFPAFWALNWVQKIMCFLSIWDDLDK